MTWMNEVELAKLRSKCLSEYEALPDFLRRKLDKACPLREEFATREEELEWLRERKSRLDSMYMGMACGVMIVLMAAAVLLYEGARVLLLALS